jgi:hypothetical protein
MATERESRDPNYHAQVDPVTSDKRARVIPRSGLRRLVVKLDLALVEQEFTVRGDFLYADSDSTGKVTVKLNNTSEDPMPFTSQARVRNYPMEKIYVSCAAQAGLVVNLWYGYSALIDPPQQTVVISGSVTLARTVAGIPVGPDLDSATPNAFELVNTAGPTVGQRAFVGCVNPTGTGKRVYVDAISENSSAADKSSIYDGNATEGADGGTSFSKQAATVAGVAHARVGTSVGILASSLAQHAGVYCQANVENRRVFTRSYVLDPGRGIYVLQVNPNLTLDVTFEIREY